MPHYLGLDSSTQSLSATIIDTESARIVAEASVNFGQTFPQYASPNGFLQHQDPAIKQSDPLMWVEALDHVLSTLRAQGVDLSKIAAISGAGQQHGSVYLSRSMTKVGSWDPNKALVDQVRPLLSRPVSPIWMDSSTSAECAEMAAAVGGDDEMVRITGSRAIERFTGAQIRKFAKQEPALWEKTQEVHLVSSFIASLLIADRAPIDFGDGAGMNLLELGTGKWNDRLLDFAAPGLRDKLAPPVASATRVGRVAEYFVTRYGLRPDTAVVAFSGDNPSSLVGMGATSPGTAVVSLGTSDTVFAAMREPLTDPNGFGHVFGNPAGGFMSLICFANGSLAREEIARRHSMSWPEFERAIVDETQPGNDGNTMLPYFVPEMTPKVPVAGPKFFGSEDFVAGRDARHAARAIVEAQALSMRIFSAWIGQAPNRILVTGGASKNRGILRVLADVFQAELVPLAVSNSSALGGALRAAHAVEGTSFDRLARAFAPPDESRQVKPNPSAAAAYAAALPEFERRLNEHRASLGQRVR